MRDGASHPPRGRKHSRHDFTYSAQPLFEVGTVIYSHLVDGETELWKVTDFPGSHRKRQSQDLNPGSLAPEPGFCCISKIDKEGQLMGSGWAPNRQGETASPPTPSGLPSSSGVAPWAWIRPALEPGPGTRNSARGPGWRPLLWANTFSSLSECS